MSLSYVYLRNVASNSTISICRCDKCGCLYENNSRHLCLVNDVDFVPATDDHSDHYVGGSTPM